MREVKYQEFVMLGGTWTQKAFATVNDINGPMPLGRGLLVERRELRLQLRKKRLSSTEIAHEDYITENH